MIPAFALSFVEGLFGPKFAHLAKPAIYALLILLVIVGLGIAKCSYDHHVIAQHDAKQTAATAIADKKADDHAADQRRTDDARLTNETTELQRSTTDAHTDLDRRLAFQRCLRLQQSARAAKRVAPACS